MKGKMIKKLKTKMLILAAAMLAILPFTPIAMVVGIPMATGCARSTNSTNSGDQVLISAEKTAEISLAVIDGFVTIEQDNRAFLNTVSPEIEKASHKVQKEGMAAWEGLRKATLTYKNNRTDDNRATMATWTATLKAFQELAQKYAIEAANALAKKRAEQPPAK